MHPTSTPPIRTPHRSRLRRSIVAIALGVSIAIAAPACDGDDDSDAGPTTTPASVTTSPAALPDFVIADATVQPGGPMVPPGEVTITAVVRNVGAAGYANAIVVQAPGNHAGVIAGGLASGASGQTEISFPVASSNATYRLTLVVDPDDVTPESNEANTPSRELVIVTSP